MSAPKIGELRQRLVFVKDTRTSDGSGGTTSVKSTDFTIWGKISQLSENEVLRSGREIGQNHCDIWVLWQSDKIPTRQHLITWNGRTYTINGVREIDELNKWIKITATFND